MGTETKRSPAATLKAKCPHCLGDIMVNAIVGAEISCNQIIIDEQKSLSYQQEIVDYMNFGGNAPKIPNTPEHRQCPECDGIIVFTDIPNITITGLADEKK